MLRKWKQSGIFKGSLARTRGVSSRALLAVAVMGAVLGSSAIASSYAAAARHGHLYVTAYRSIGGNPHAERLPGVKVSLNRDCNDAPKRDRVTRDAGAGHPDNGTAFFTNCPVDRTTNIGNYRVSVEPPPGFRMADIQQKDIQIRWAGLVSRSEVNFIFERNPDVPIAPSTPPVVKDPDPGEIQVTSYVKKDDGGLERIGNVEVHTRSVGFTTEDKAHNCNPYNKRTNSDKSSTGYGQATFPNCWSGSEGHKQYVLNYLSIPAGYKFKSVHSPELNLHIDDDYTQANFTVRSAPAVTKIQIWLIKEPDPPPVAAPTPENPTPAATPRPTRQVVTTPQITEQVIARDPAAAAAAAASQQKPDGSSSGPVADPGAGSDSCIDDPEGPDCANFDPCLTDPTDPTCEPLIEPGVEGDLGEELLGDTGEPDPATPATTGDVNPPSTVTQLEVAAKSGGIAELKWQAATDDISLGSYTIERSVDGTTWDVIADSITDNDYVDEEAGFGRKLRYRVTAIDEAGNPSSPAAIDIDIPTFSANVSGDSDTQTVLEGEEDGIRLDIPAGATDEDRSCGVYIDDDTGQEDLPLQAATPSGPYKVICRDEDGTVSDGFDEDVDLYISADENDTTMGDELGLYAHDEEGWKPLATPDEGAIGDANVSVTTKNGKRVYKVRTKNPQLLAVLASRNSSNPLPLVIAGLGFIVSVSAAGILLFRRLNPQLIPAEKPSALDHYLPKRPKQ